MSSSTRSKGDRAERKLCSILSSLGIPFSRQRSSGQVHGDGDIATNLYCIEVKSGKSVSLTSNLMEKIRKEAQRAGRAPLLVCMLTNDKNDSYDIAVVVPNAMLLEFLHGTIQESS